MVDLTALNTLALPSMARYLKPYENAAQLAELSAVAADHEHVFVLGGGSNVVLMPNIQSLIIHVRSRGIEVLQDDPEGRLIDVAAGESWHAWVAWCIERGWGGLENLALIPGTVGAAPVQNIGAYGVELARHLHSVQVWDIEAREMKRLSGLDCGFGYRDSIFKRTRSGRWLILSVRFLLPRQWTPVLNYPDLQHHDALLALQRQRQLQPADVFHAVCNIRRNKLPDPAMLPNAGSFFKNPTVTADHHAQLVKQWPRLRAFRQDDGQWKLAAGWLIERVGWRGKALGPAGMHAHQALVLVNHGGADAHDVLRLAQQVRSDVYQRFGVTLEHEPVTVN